MNTITKNETQISIYGIDARAFNVVTADSGRILNQKIKTFAREYTEGGTRHRIHAELRFDDSCGNGHETFAITGTIDRYERGAWRDDAGGCIHDEIVKHFPALAPLIKWHLCSTDGPLHYVANTVYHAGNRDHNGLRKGDTRQIINGRTGEPCWTLKARNAPGVKISSTPTGDEYRDQETVPLFILDNSANGAKPDLVPVLEWCPLLTHGEGKARELDHARSAAIWPEATDADLMQEPEALKAALLARLPALLAEFKAAMLGAGFVYPAQVTEKATA